MDEEDFPVALISDFVFESQKITSADINTMHKHLNFLYSFQDVSIYKTSCTIYLTDVNRLIKSGEHISLAKNSAKYWTMV